MNVQKLGAYFFYGPAGMVAVVELVMTVCRGCVFVQHPADILAAFSPSWVDRVLATESWRTGHTAEVPYSGLLVFL